MGHAHKVQSQVRRQNIWPGSPLFAYRMLFHNSNNNEKTHYTCHDKLRTLTWPKKGALTTTEYRVKRWQKKKQQLSPPYPHSSHPHPHPRLELLSVLGDGYLFECPLFYCFASIKDIWYYSSHWNIFNTLHTVCLMHELSIYEIKRICHHAQSFIISYGSLQHLTNLSS